MKVSMGKKVSKGAQNQFSWGDTVFQGTGKKKSCYYGRRVLGMRN